MRRARTAGPTLPARVSALLLAPAVALATGACEHRESPAPGGGPDLERMIDQRRFDAWEATGLFADGSVMRPPPEGTVPRERLLGPPALVDAREAGEPVTAIPVPLTRELLERGRDRFEVFCAACHGADGSGDTPVAEAMTLRPPPSLHRPAIRALPDGALYLRVRDGYGLMPAYGEELGVVDRWAVVGYLRALQLSRRAPVDELPPPARRRLELGTGPAAEAREEAR